MILWTLTDEFTFCLKKESQRKKNSRNNLFSPNREIPHLFWEGAIKKENISIRTWKFILRSSTGSEGAITEAFWRAYFQFVKWGTIFDHKCHFFTYVKINHHHNHSLYYYLHHHQNFQYSNSPAPSSALYSNITHCHHRNRHISEEQSSPVSSLPWPSLLPWPSTPLSSTPHGNHHMVITCISKPDMRGVITWPESIGCFRGCRRRLF